jgi:hypothetical protein
MSLNLSSVRWLSCLGLTASNGAGKQRNAWASGYLDLKMSTVLSTVLRLLCSAMRLRLGIEPSLEAGAFESDDFVFFP